MIVAQREYSYADEVKGQLKEDEHKKKKNKTDKDKKINASHKVQIIFSIVLIAGLCMGVLLGYVQLTEAKYRVYYLNKEITKLEGEIENLKVSVEGIQKSHVIEEKAKTELGMQYPEKQQMVFLDKMDSTKMGVEDTEENIEKNIHVDNNGLMTNVLGVFRKVYSLLD